MSARFLTAREVAEIVGVTPETVLRWTRRGAIPAVRLPGGGLRYPETALEQWTTDRAVGSPPDTLDLNISPPRRDNVRGHGHQESELP